MDDPVVQADLADSAPERRPGPWKLILIVAVVTLIGVWLVPSEPPQQVSTPLPQTASPAQPETVTDGAAPAPSLLEEGTPIDASGDLTAMLPPPQAGMRPGARARSLIADMRTRGGTLDLQAVYDAAMQAQEDGELADAYLLYFFAAREGHVDAALALGTQADPATHVPGGSVFEAADMNQAHKWYQIAAQHGNLEASKLLADLRSRIEQLAAAGDTQAQRLALLWQ